MTLVLSELSKVGIAMATDPAITKNLNNTIVEVDTKGMKQTY